jgi:polar amino acid transport system substrate-binding protein
MSVHGISRRAVAVGISMMSTLVVAAACGSSTPSSHSTSSADGAVKPPGRVDSIHAKLPADVKSSGAITVVYGGQAPPYFLPKEGSVEGVGVELGNALAGVMGVKVKYLNIGSLPSLIATLQAGRADLTLGPWGDNAERQQVGTFLDWVHGKVAFLVSKDNPKKIDGLDTVCGSRVALIAGGQAAAVMQAQSKKCESEGKAAVDMQTYHDSATASLAVSSGRADAYFSSVEPLTYYARQPGASLKLVGTDESNGFGKLPMGAIVRDESGMLPAMRAAFDQLLSDGTYEKIMDGSGLQLVKVQSVGVNLGK